MATNKSLKRDLKIMAESGITGDKESSVDNNDISILKNEEIMINIDNGSTNKEDEKIITNFNISESPIDQTNVNKKLAKDINTAQTLEEQDSREDGIKGQNIIKDLINEEEGCNMKFEIFKKYIELCNEVGLIPSWSELTKFKKYYVG
ncbi:hypothetical protein [Clostridium chromiireducens]|nr:hypothetical protein [Clostridium chromiireducens]